MADGQFIRPRIMGILNLTHDSFFAPSRVPEPEAALRQATEMVRDGADILDVGAESSRPGSEYVALAEELERIVPVVSALHEAFPNTPVSVDTRKAAVAKAALDAGASIINDISALRDDAAMTPLIAERGAQVILMHMRGTPLTMQEAPSYDDPVAEVSGELAALAASAVSGGIDPAKIILDPGIGFGKRVADNWALLRNVSTIRQIGYPVVIGLSRKSFLGHLLADSNGVRGVEGRLNATIAGQLWCTLHGVEIIRVHDVQAMRDALRVWEELLAAGPE